MNKILIIAGDTSGDIHAAKLMKEILIRRPDTKFIGVGGEKMSSIDFEKIIDLSQISVVGFWEVFKRIDKFLQLKSKIKEIIEKENISLFIPVDFPGFNLEIAKLCKQYNIKVLWYIAPQLWAWGKNRAKKLQNNIDKLLAVFPFEEEFFGKYDIDTEFVGHPLMDNPQFNQAIKKWSERENILLIMPGSRIQEISSHLPLLLEYCKIFRAKYPNFDIVFSVPTHTQQFLYTNFAEIKKFNIVNDSHKHMQSSKIGLIKSGTSNLEAALLGLPFVMFYKTSLFNYIIGKQMANVPYFSIVNILSNKSIVTELIQSRMNLKNIEKHIDILMNDKQEYENLQNSFEKIKELFKNKKASARAAEIAINFLETIK